MDTSSSAPRAAGERDTSFATNGVFTFTRGHFGSMTIGRTCPTSDGKLLIAASQNRNVDYYALIRLNAEGTLDTSFGAESSGMVTGQFRRDTPSWGGSVTETADSKILLSGIFLTQLFGPPTPALARFNNRGELDPSFGDGGVIALQFAPPVNQGNEKTDNTPSGPPDPMHLESSAAISLMPDGRIVFCCYRAPIPNDPTSRFSVLGRLTADGHFDESFNRVGYVYLPGEKNAAAIHLPQEDGGIIVCGDIQEKEQRTAYVTRYLKNGQVDRAYGSNGIVYLRDMFTDGYVVTATIHGDNKILLAANQVKAGPNLQWNGVLQGLHSDASRDVDFNHGQPVEMSLGTSSFICTLKDILINGNGVLLMGTMGNMALARYLLNGLPDTTYGDSNGWWQYTADNTYDLARQPDGKIVATAMASITQERIVARFLAE